MTPDYLNPNHGKGLDTAQRVFDAALAPLRADGMKAEVTVRNDLTHGTLAEVPHRRCE